MRIFHLTTPEDWAAAQERRRLHDLDPRAHPRAGGLHPLLRGAPGRRGPARCYADVAETSCCSRSTPTGSPRRGAASSSTGPTSRTRTSTDRCDLDAVVGVRYGSATLRPADRTAARTRRSADQPGDLVRAAPGQGDPGARRARSSARPGALAARPRGGPRDGPGAGRPGGRSTRAPASAGTSSTARSQDRASPTSGSGSRSHSPSSSVPPTTMSRERGTTYVGAGAVEPPALEADLLDVHDLAAHRRARDGSPASRRAPSPVRVDHHLGRGRAAPASAIRVTVPPSRSTRRDQPAQVDRHLDDRRHERPRRRRTAPASALTRVSAGTASRHHGSGCRGAEHLGPARASARRCRRRPASPLERGVRRRATTP